MTHHLGAVPETTSEQRAADRLHRAPTLGQRRDRRDPAWRIARRNAVKRAMR